MLALSSAHLRSPLCSYLRCQRPAYLFVNVLSLGRLNHSGKQHGHGRENTSARGEEAHSVAGINPLVATAKLEKVLSKTLKLIDAKFDVPTPPQLALPPPTVNATPRLNVLKSSLSLFDGDATPIPDVKQPPPAKPPTPEPSAKRKSEFRSRSSPPQQRYGAQEHGLPRYFKDILTEYSIAMAKSLAGMNETKRDEFMTENALETLELLASGPFVFRDAMRARELLSDKRFLQILRVLHMPRKLSNDQVVKGLTALQRMGLREHLTSISSLEEELLSRVSRLDLAGLLDLGAALVRNQLFRPDIAEHLWAALSRNSRGGHTEEIPKMDQLRRYISQCEKIQAKARNSAQSR